MVYYFLIKFFKKNVECLAFLNKFDKTIKTRIKEIASDNR
jgi:hypothetical protein